MTEPCAGRDLDALVAEKVMGLVRCQGKRHNAEYPNTYCYARPESPENGGEVLEYSTRIEAAWEVVEKVLYPCRWYLVPMSDDRVSDDRGWGVFEGDDWYEVALGESAPLAICRAALEAARRDEALRFATRE